jgi:hypothetical protein
MDCRREHHFTVRQHVAQVDDEIRIASVLKRNVELGADWW